MRTYCDEWFVKMICGSIFLPAQTGAAYLFAPKHKYVWLKTRLFTGGTTYSPTFHALCSFLYGSNLFFGLKTNK